MIMKDFVAIQTIQHNLIFSEIKSKEKIGGLCFLESSKHPKKISRNISHNKPVFKKDEVLWDVYRLHLGKTFLFKPTEYGSYKRRQFVSLPEGGFAESTEHWVSAKQEYEVDLQPTRSVIIPMRCYDMYSPFVLSFEDDEAAELFFEIKEL